MPISPRAIAQMPSPVRGVCCDGSIRIRAPLQIVGYKDSTLPSARSRARAPQDTDDATTNGRRSDLPFRRHHPYFYRPCWCADRAVQARQGQDIARSLLNEIPTADPLNSRQRDPWCLHDGALALFQTPWRSSRARDSSWCNCSAGCQPPLLGSGPIRLLARAAIG